MRAVARQFQKTVWEINNDIGVEPAERVGTLIRFLLPSALLGGSYFWGSYPLAARVIVLNCCIFGGVADLAYREGYRGMHLKTLATSGAAALAVSSMIWLCRARRATQTPEILSQIQAMGLTSGLLAASLGGVELHSIHNDKYLLSFTFDRRPKRLLFHLLAPFISGLAYELLPSSSFNIAANVTIWSSIAIALCTPPEGFLSEEPYSGNGALILGGSLALLPLSFLNTWRGPDWLSRSLQITCALGQSLILVGYLLAT